MNTNFYLIIFYISLFRGNIAKNDPKDFEFESFLNNLSANYLLWLGYDSRCGWKFDWDRRNCFITIRCPKN